MKSIVCEMCGSSDMLKQEGVFVCQNCGMKYSVEEAKRMMIEGTVDVQGTVKLDRSDEIAKLYQAARNAIEASDAQTAIRHYESISAKDPSSWEALFYLTILKTDSIKNGEIHSSAITVSNCLPKVFDLIAASDMSEEDKKAAVEDVVETCAITAQSLTDASNNFLQSLTSGNGAMMLTGLSGMITAAGSNSEYAQENQNRCFACARIMEYCGIHISNKFGREDKDYKKYIAFSWKTMLNLHTQYQAQNKGDLFNKETIEIYNRKVREIEPDYAGVTVTGAGKQVARVLIPIAIALAIGIAIATIISQSGGDLYNILWFL